ncbi:hypothetical protein WICPIJ_002373 [Wickerhamomyces pijperi]|uniref:Uncharacterized protein n=1 Tax=Wickerhamomyces pijperi TaxID=599730 RepID=A0A9P8QBZ9_WICPI|nr:hypothetical protein WICPIJ_002373 [Wickerhamomyces pijperi]
MAVKKREIFQVEKHDYHEDKLVSYKDIRTTELNSHTCSHAGLDFHNALLEKMKDHTRNDSTDLSFIFVAFKFTKMYLSCSEANDIAVNLPNEFPNRDWGSCSFFAIQTAMKRKPKTSRMIWGAILVISLKTPRPLKSV